MGRTLTLKSRFIFRVLLFLAFVQTAAAWAQCLSLIKGPVTVDVTSCGPVDPATGLTVPDDMTGKLQGLDANDRKNFYNSYRGVLMRGKIVQSQALRQGAVESKTGALQGDSVLLYVRPGQGACPATPGERLSGQLEEVCCAGSAEPPCLLKTDFILSNFKSIGKAGSAAGDETRAKLAKSEDFKKGEIALTKKDYRTAAKHLEAARARDELDATGSFHLGVVYRKLDTCEKAIVPLRTVYERSLQGQVWADQERIVRQSNFLLARCYARLARAGDAVLILQGYLIEPRKYKGEINQSLKNSDFGWIHTSKEYREYKTAAEAKLRKL